MELKIINAQGQVSGALSASDALFAREYNEALVHQLVTAFLANARSGNRAQLTRAEVKHSTKKPWRQKGTGRARQGSIRAPQWTGGGIVHGPQPRDYSQKTPKKMKAAALRQALSDRARAGRIHVLSDFGMTETPSTKAAKAALQKVVENRHALIVLTPEVDDIVALSVNNLNEHHALFVGQLNTYDVLVNDDVVFSATALENFLRKEEN